MVKPQTIKRYLARLKDKYPSSNNTVRLKMSACSSFYSDLFQNEHIKRNPFKGVKLPAKEYKTAVETDQKKTVPVMTVEEYKAVVEALEERMEQPGSRNCDRLARAGARRLYVAVHYMATYGIRAGAVHTIRNYVERNENRFSYTTKGRKSSSKPLMPITWALNSEYREEVSALSSYMLNSMQTALRKITQELAGKDIIRYAYSAHDFRHFFAHQSFTEEYFHHTPEKKKRYCQLLWMKKNNHILMTSYAASAKTPSMN